MSQERYTIILDDKIPDSIGRKLAGIANAAGRAHKNVTLLNRALRSTNRTTTRIAKQTRKVNELRRAYDRTQGSVERLRSSLHNLFAITAIASQLDSVVQLTDAYTNLQNKLKNITDSEEQLFAVTNKLFDLSKRTRSSVDATARAFARFDLALIQLGESQETTFKLTEAVNKALTLSGAGTAETASALLQLSQAFNKGKLDGDEFRSVMELMPIAADAIAKQLRVTRGELLNLAPEGKITADVMLKAFLNASDQIDKKFATTVPTISQSLVVLRDQFVKFIGEQDKAAGITQSLAKAILTLADNIDILANILTGIALRFGIVFGARMLAKIYSFRKAFLALNTAMRANPIGLIATALASVVTLFNHFKNDIKLSNDGMLTLGDITLAVFQSIGELLVKVGAALKKLIISIGGFIMEMFQEILNFTNKIFGTSLTSKSILKSFTDLGKTAGNFFLKSFENELGLDFGKIFDKIEAKARKNAADRLAKQKATGSDTDNLRGKVRINTKFPQARGLGTERKIRGGKTVLDTNSIHNLPQTLEKAKSSIQQINTELSEMQSLIKDNLSNLGNAMADIVAEKIVFTESFFTNFKDTALSTWKAIREEAKHTLASIISGFIKMGVQWVATAVLGQSLTNALVGQQSVVAATLSKAYATPAALASLATLGANAKPAVAGIATTVSFSKAMAGFQSGGYTGNMRENQVAGVVHGKEFVVNAQATRANRAPLERLNKGGKLTNDVNVTIHNNAPVSVRAEQIGPNDIRVIIRDELETNGDDLFARNIMNPNSQTSKTLNQHTNLKRVR